MKNPISLKLLHLLTRISYWGLIIVTAIVVFAGIIMITLDPQQMKLGIPANLSHMEEVIYLESDPGTPVEVEFGAASIEVPVRHLDTPTICYLLFMALLWLTCVIYIARYFKTFMKKVLDGQIFQTESIFLIKKAALGLVILEAIEWVAATIGYFYIQRKFDLGGLEHKYAWEFPSFNLILALTLWALAYIFQKGKELEDEQKLTV